MGVAFQAKADPEIPVVVPAGRLLPSGVAWICDLSDLLLP